MAQYVTGEQLLVGRTQVRLDNRNRYGTVFYQISDNGPFTATTPVDGGVSATFPDCIFLEQNP